MLSLPEALPEGMELKLAESVSEYTQAFQILHDSYVDAGFMEKDSTGMRITPYHLLNSTSTYVAVENGKVIATIAMVRDNPFGLPMDKVFDLNQFRQKNERIGEVSALAIHRDFRGQSGILLFCLIRFMWLHTLTRHRIDHLVIAVNPEKEDLYRSVFNFENLPGQSYVSSYSFVQGAPAVGQWMNIKNSQKILQSIYQGKSKKNNLFDFFFQSPEFQALQAEIAPYYTLFKQSNMDTKMRIHFLKDVAPIWAKMASSEQAKFAQALGVTDPDMIFVSPENLAPKDFFRQPRTEVDCPVLQLDNIASIGQSSLGIIPDLSEQGFKILFSGPHSPNMNQSEYAIKVALGPNIDTQLRARLVWREDKKMGFTVVDADQSWADFFQSLNQAEGKRAA